MGSATAATSPKITSKYGAVPLAFEENRGQIDRKASFLLRGGNLNLFVTKTGALLSLKKDHAQASVGLEVVDASANATVTGEAPLEGHSSYFRGNDPAKWITAVPRYEKVRIGEIRKGVDLLYYANEKQLEYDLIIKPGTRPADIRLRFTGAQKMSLTPEGDLKIQTAAGDLVQHAPRIWQQSGKTRDTIAGRYRISRNGEVSVLVSRYDPHRELVIDPVISYSTYLRGGGQDQGSAIAVDSSGNAYITGWTTSVNFPTSVGAFSVAQKNTSMDVFITKVNSSGTALLYSTFLGGATKDNGNAIAVDASGNAYITGFTDSTDFPVTPGAFQGTRKSSGQNTDVFVTKLNPTGTALVYSTYVGGSGYQNATGIQVDGTANAYIAGYTSSVDFPTTNGAYLTNLRGQAAAFVAKVNPAGTQLVYSTYLGGSDYGDYDNAAGIALDTFNNAYIVGVTESLHFPTTAGAYQSAPQAGTTINAFVSQISADGSKLKASTYLGGGWANVSPYTSYTFGKAIAVDSSNNPYVAGSTESTSFPTTLNAFSTSSTSSIKGFVTKLNPSLTSLTYSSYLGGSSSDLITAMAVDSAGDAYVVGDAGLDFPITPGALFTKPINSNSRGSFLAQFDPGGSSLTYSTLLSGDGAASAAALAVDGAQGVYITGEISGDVYPVTPGAFQSGGTGFQGFHSFVTKIDTKSQVNCALSISPSNYAAPLTGGSSSFAITVPPGCPWVIDNPSGLVLSGPLHGFGNATIGFTLPSNAGGVYNLSPTLTVGASTFSITQPSGSCAPPGITPTFANFGSGGGTGQISINLPVGCPFTATSSAPWLTLTSGLSGNAGGTVNYIVDRNDFSIRSASISIGSVNFPVTQSGGGCTASASVVAGTAGAGGTGFIALTTSSNACLWKAYSAVPWIQLGTITGQGPMAIGITVAPNPGTLARTGRVQIADQTLILTQASGPFGTPSAYTISTVAGNGVYGYLGEGDGGPALSAGLGIHGVAFDPSGNLFIGDVSNRVRRVGADGKISTVAGNGSNTYSGDGGPATAAGIDSIASVAFGPAGELYIGHGFYTNVIRKVINGTISTLVTGTALSNLAVDSTGNVYASWYDYSGGYGHIQKVAPGGTVSEFAGASTGPAFGGDGGPPASATMSNILGLAFDKATNLYVSDAGNDRIRRISGNTVSTVAGTGDYGFNGDGPATSTMLAYPAGLVTDPAGNVLIADQGNFRIRRLTPSGTLSTIAGSGKSYSGHIDAYTTGDGGPALSAAFGSPIALAMDPSGNIAVADSNNVVRLLTPSAYSFCNYTLSSSSASVPIAGATLTPAVTTTSGCVWNAISSAPWIFVPVSAGTGFGTASLQVAANNASSPRTGTVSIAGQPFTVTQAGIPMVPAAVSVSPAAGSGTAQTFTVVYTDSAGANALNRRLFLINSTVIGAGGCFIQADATGLYLVNDAGTATQPANALSNSQCTLNGPGSSVVNSGNSSTLTLAITFAPGFAGAKTIYMYTEDSGSNTGFQPRGSFTVLAAPPAAVSVTPGSASGSTQTFTAVYSGPAGAASLNRRLFLINSTLLGAGACFVQADPTGIYLVNDAGSGLLGPLSSGGTFTNSQCTLNGIGTGITNSGTTSTVTISLTFKAAFAGPKNIYLYADDSFNNNSGFQTRGTYSVTFGAPTADSVTPAANSGTAQTFTATYSDPAGAATFNRRLFLINSILSGPAACFVQTDPTGIYLVNDAGSGLLGPITGGATLSNSQCTLNGTGTGVVSSGNTSTVTISLTFKPSFAGAKNIYLYAEDTNGNNSGFQLRGTYTVASTLPTADSVTPSSASGTTQTFTAVYSDGSGAAALNRRLFLISSALNGAGACFVQADPTGIYLVNDADSALLGPVPPGSTLSNTQCTLNGTGSSVVNSGNASTLTLSIAFKPAFAGAKNIYIYADDASGNNNGFQLRGTYTVSGTPSVPTNTSVTPNSGSGATQTFTLVYSDAAGNSLLNRRLFLINSTLTGAGGCFVQVDPTGIYLANDADSALTGPLFTNSTLTNSQCTLNGAGASVSYSATSTTVVLPITFKPGFGGTRNIYMYVDDTSGNNSGFQLMGTITTQ